MPKKISREAEESGADPGWLTGASSPPQMASLNAAEVRADFHGRDEAWWREKVLTQRAQLMDAAENYGKAHEKYSKDVENLGPSRFGRLTLTQYQMISCRLDVLSNEMARYEAQIAEARERLENLLKKAEESKADPDWVRQ